MLELKLRGEFLGEHMPGTAISLRTPDNQGAAQKSPEQILAITYPTADVQTALKALSTKTRRRPIVLLGDRGRGKSHIMAVMHHAVQSPEIVETWMRDWGTRLGCEELKSASLVKGYIAISEPVHNHEYPLLWNLLFDRHPRGDFYRGQFAAKKQPFPPRTLLEKMFEEKPTCLILDEFQKWFDGLSNEPGDEGIKYSTWAENFIQNLSEIANDRPEILILAISVLDNTTDAFQQVHRQGPLVIDFQTPSAKQDRQKLLLHRLFENRRNIPDLNIAAAASAYASERFRLLYPNKSDSEKDRIRQEVFRCWPFSPELLTVLEDHILLSAAAQETRDMIKILAQAYRSRGEQVPILTPADFLVDGTSDQVQTLIDSIADSTSHDQLRRIAQRNLEAVLHSEVNVPNARELISAIWMRSLSPGKGNGGNPSAIHLDITRGIPIDDNAFQAELALLIENSVNIHGDEIPDGPLWFTVNENPRSRVRATAKNPKLWQIGATPAPGQSIYPGMDVAYLRRTLRHILVPETTQPTSRVIVLGPNWKTAPWSDLEENDQPDKWDRPILLVVPDQLEGGPSGINACLGPWLAKHVQKRRNTIRFLLPASDALSLYQDEELLYCARCSFLCSREGWGSDFTYNALHRDFDRQLRAALKSRFNRFAVLRKWDYQQPQYCTFEIEKISEQGSDIPSAVEKKLVSDLFDPSDFQSFVLKRAKESDFVGSLMDDLIEPPPPGTGEAIPFLGETFVYELILRIVATGAAVLNVEGKWISRRTEDATDEEAFRYIRGQAFRSGQEMRRVQLGLPGTVGGGTVTVPKPTAATVTALTPTAPATGATGSTTPLYPTTPVPAVNPAGNFGLNGNKETPLPPPSNVKTKKSEAPATCINLSGCFETWAVPTSQQIESARIEFSGLSAQQIKQILQRIPSTFKATLEITYTEGGPS
jgi:hypothetical protein